MSEKEVNEVVNKLFKLIDKNKHKHSDNNDQFEAYFANNQYQGIESNIDFKGFYTIDSDVEKIAKKLIETVQLDFINANIGKARSLCGLSRSLPDMPYKLLLRLDHVAKFRLVIYELIKNSNMSDKNKNNENEIENENKRMQFFHAGMIMVVSTPYVIESDITDMVRMTRAHMTDQHIVSKLINGQKDDVRACVGAAYCFDRIYTASESTQNILIIGDGIACLECAQILAILGHNVTLYVAGKTFGEQIQLVSEVTLSKDSVGIVEMKMKQFQQITII